MAVQSSTPHDGLFKAICSRKAEIAGILRANLPGTLAARLDFDCLELQPAGFVEQNLRAFYSDLLFRTRLSGHDAYVYVLVEHQSCPDRFMPMRMLRYILMTWTQHLDAHPNSKAIPAVIPLVVHSGPRGERWNYPTELGELIDLDDAGRAELAEYLPSLKILLDDLSQVDIDAIQARDLTPPARLVLILHKITAKNTNLGHVLQRFIADLNDLTTDDLWRVFEYIFLEGDTGLEDLQALLNQLGPRAKEVAVTTAERLRAEGRVQGRAEGRVEGEARALLTLLAAKFESLPTAVVDRVRSARTDELEAWMPRVLTATTVDEIFTPV
ncbi:Rpn family recombination-promoting nuclease/putative transposase [Nocardia flavorosea]|uniref:Rpn family recombination-promoting nuclease/putative transposase n=1 Tax=Nocardia flavorosea TaxID=53429 RepID=A0A846YDZ1_9NOCA|nr:Rpn family recombination-promoting nuclease/putative transposase [Nocardia flavorosea]NKY55960.1 Rpn family recombination-promoting nuclease/putative transposase [Nocardia flavorosea]